MMTLGSATSTQAISIEVTILPVWIVGLSLRHTLIDGDV
jgi:hypothetical protein